MAREPETVIITIGYYEKNIFIDMEIPADVPVNVLKNKILEILRNMYEGIFAGWNEYNIAFNNRFLQDDETLISAGAYEGSYLYVSKK